MKKTESYPYVIFTGPTKDDLYPVRAAATEEEAIQSARAICQYGQCKECTEDCVDYRAAMRVATELEANGVVVLPDEAVNHTEHENMQEGVSHEN